MKSLILVFVSKMYHIRLLLLLILTSSPFNKPLQPNGSVLTILLIWLSWEALAVHIQNSLYMETPQWIELPAEVVVTLFKPCNPLWRSMKWNNVINWISMASNELKYELVKSVKYPSAMVSLDEKHKVHFYLISLNTICTESVSVAVTIASFFFFFSSLIYFIILFWVRHERG